MAVFGKSGENRAVLTPPDWLLQNLNKTKMRESGQIVAEADRHRKPTLRHGTHRSASLIEFINFRYAAGNIRVAVGVKRK